VPEFMSQNSEKDGRDPEKSRLNGMLGPDKIGGEKEEGLDRDRETEEAELQHQDVRVSCAEESRNASGWRRR